MDKKNLSLYKTIGEIHSTIAISKTFDEAIKNGLKHILDNCLADYAIIWIKSKEENFMSPYYWICPFDCADDFKLTKDDVISKCCINRKTTNENDIKKDSILRASVKDAKSVVCVPFSTDPKANLGCIEFIKNDKSGNFTDDEINVCEILTMLFELEIHENAPINDSSKKEVIITCNDIKKSFKNGELITNVLKGINFKVYKGEFLCLLGESGCGKSTLLNIIGGLIPADSGSVKFEDLELVGLDDKQLTKYRRENIGFIFQQYNLMNNLTAVENVRLIAELVKEPMLEDDALKLVKMVDKKDSYPSQLSGGQQQRISIARALVKKPKLLIADEPTAALDYETSIEVLSAFEDVLKTGTTLIMVTHNEEIAKMADRVIRFKNGQIYETSVNLHPLKADKLVW